MPRWLALDHGHKRIGVAVGNTEDGFATPLSVLNTEPSADIHERICKLSQEYDPAGIVVGLPLNMDDTIGPQAMEALRFAEKLAQHSGLDVRMWDERLSSFDADKALAGHLTRKKRRAHQDAVAAASFLQDFLQGDGPKNAKHPAEFITKD
ncbi:MAG: Holliday junction resolvase RuvX [Phycisphaerae bacterium]|nr:Holliday junction resolvase RuvX [Phycisphaerae bacterium]